MIENLSKEQLQFLDDTIFYAVYASVSLLLLYTGGLMYYAESVVIAESFYLSGSDYAPEFYRNLLLILLFTSSIKIYWSYLVPKGYYHSTDISLELVRFSSIIFSWNFLLIAAVYLQNPREIKIALVKSSFLTASSVGISLLFLSSIWYYNFNKLS
jgi:hypothetical protein